MNHFDRVEPARTALIVVDLQQAYVAEGQPFASGSARAIVPNVNRLSAATRAAGGRVFFLRQTFTDEPPQALPEWQRRVSPKVRLAREAVRAGGAAHGLYEGLEVRPDDVTIDKYRYSAFARHSSRLEDELRAAGTDTVIIVGAATNVCCESTARDAFMLGFRVFFISDATAALTDEEHNAALLNLRAVFADLRSTSEMLELLAVTA
jgi:nicotinamidase-related amidase